jgi:hypothetical protein
VRVYQIRWESEERIGGRELGVCVQATLKEQRSNSDVCGGVLLRCAFPPITDSLRTTSRSHSTKKKGKEGGQPQTRVHRSSQWKVGGGRNPVSHSPTHHHGQRKVVAFATLNRQVFERHSTKDDTQAHISPRRRTLPDVCVCVGAWKRKTWGTQAKRNEHHRYKPPGSGNASGRRM